MPPRPASRGGLDDDVDVDGEEALDEPEAEEVEPEPSAGFRIVVVSGPGVARGTKRALEEVHDSLRKRSAADEARALMGDDVIDFPPPAKVPQSQPPTPRAVEAAMSLVE